MSLTAWYPFNGNARDYSGNERHGTPTGVAVDTAGKLGSCYLFDGTAADYVTIPNSAVNDVYDFTVTCWFNSSNMTKALNTPFHATSTGGNDLAIYVQPTAIKIAMNNSEYSFTITLSPNTWYHLAALRRGSQTTLFVNGIPFVYQTCVTTRIHIPANGYIQIGQEADAVGGGFDASQAMQGRLNDVRIYDHALTDKDIKEIARAKAVHYTFDDFQEPTVNLLYSPGAANLVSAIDLYGKATKTNLGGGRYRFDNDGTGGSTVRLYCNLSDLTNGYSYGVSVYYYAIKGTVSVDWCDTALSSLVDTGDRITGVGTRGTYDATYRFVDVNLSTGSSVVLWNPQVERKNYVTDFVAGTRSGRVRDASGLRNHADLTLDNTPRWVPGRIGSGAYYFDGGVRYINFDTLGTTTSLSGFTDCTVSFWRKNDVTVQSWLPFMGQTTSYYIMATSGGTGNFYHSNIGSSWTIYKDGINSGQSVAPFTDQEWHHYVIKGVNLSAWTSFSLGKYSGEWYNEGYFDDVRIYNTSLSDEDVLDLYRVRGSLDLGGNLYINELHTNGASTDLHNHIEYYSIDQGTYPAGSNQTWYGPRRGKAINYIPNSKAGNSCKVEVKINPANELDVVSSFYTDSSNFQMYSRHQTYSYFSVDPSRAYRFSQWLNVHLEGTSSGQNNYVGIEANTVCNVNTTTPNSNPYMTAPTLNDSNYLDKWVLQVFYIYPYGTTNNPTQGKLYKTDGTSLNVGSNYNWNAGISSSMIRNQFIYQYSDVSAGTYVRLYRQRVEVVDGSEPTINDLIRCVEHRPLTKDSVTIWDDRSIGSDGTAKFGSLSEVAISDGLVGYWKLDGDARDYSGRGSHGTVTGAVVSSGKKAKSYLFNGTSDYINCGNGSALHLSSSITISAWVYPHTTSSLGNIIAKYGNQGYRYRIDGTDGANTLWWYVSGNSVAGGYVPLNTWSHCLVTGDSLGLSCYLNGSLVASNSTAYAPIDSTSGNLYIGAASPGTEHFDGNIADVRIYDRALSTDEINILYKWGLTNTGMQLYKDGTLFVNSEIKEAL